MEKPAQKIFTERLNALIEEQLESPSGKKRFNAAAVIATAVQRSQSAVRKWLSGEGLPDIEPLMDLCTYFKCSPNYLLGVDDHRSSLSVESAEPASPAPLAIPVLSGKKQGWICSGFSSMETLFNLTSQGGSFFFLHAPSDSMWPTIRINERILVKYDINSFEENEILLVYFDGSLAIRRLQRRFGACAVMSDNKEHYPEVLVDHQKIHFLNHLADRIASDVGLDPDHQASSAIDLVLDGMPLLDILKHFQDVLIVIGQVTSAVRSFSQPLPMDDFHPRSV